MKQGNSNNGRGGKSGGGYGRRDGGQGKPFQGRDGAGGGDGRSFRKDGEDFFGKRGGQGGDRQGFGGGKPTGQGGRPNYDKPRGEGRSFGDERKPFNNERKPYDGERKPYDGERKPFNGERKPFNNDRKPFNNDRKPYDGERKPFNGERKPFGGERRPYDGERKPFNNERKPFGGERRPYDGERKPFNNERKPFGGERRPYDGERKPFNNDRKPFGGGYKPYVKPIPTDEDAYVYRPEEDTASASLEARVQDAQQIETLLVGRNPIREALKSGRSIDKLMVAKGELSGSAREIYSMAREKGVFVQYVDKRHLDALHPRHQGMIAQIPAREYADVVEMLDEAGKASQPLVVILDGVTDPHNLGAIIRSAECMGANGVIIPERRSAGLTPVAVKASAGAVEHIKVGKAPNLAALLDELKARGYWVFGADATGQPVSAARLDGPVALVIGDEGEGLSRLTRERCDALVRINMQGEIESLNASVAAGVLLYEISRRRGHQ